MAKTKTRNQDVVVYDNNEVMGTTALHIPPGTQFSPELAKSFVHCVREMFSNLKEQLADHGHDFVVSEFIDEDALLNCSGPGIPFVRGFCDHCITVAWGRIVTNQESDDGGTQEVQLCYHFDNASLLVSRI